MRRFLLLSALALVWSLGCGGDKHPSNVEDPSGGADAKGGHSSRGGAGGSSDGGRSNGGASNGGETSSGGAAGNSASTVVPGAPVVRFLSPSGNLDPNSDAVITENEITVTCKPEASPEPNSTVDPTSTLISMTQGGRTITEGLISTRLVDGANETRFKLDGLTAGEIAFECTAEDLSSEPRVGRAEPLKILIDRGPQIAFTAPSTGQAVALTDGVDVEFTVSSPEIGDGDTKSSLASVVVKVNGQEVTVRESSTKPGTYQDHINFNDPLRFPPGTVPSGATGLQVLATNARGTVASAVLSFAVDSTPPNISYVNPPASAVIGATTTIEFKVEDELAGVDESTVAVRINSGGLHFYDEHDAGRWEHIKGSPTYKFTTTKSDFATSVAQATINVTATDRVHNATPGATSRLYFLDTEPPIIGLDVPTVRELYYDTDEATNVCSNAFDPLGEAINDLAIDNGADTFRALVWDDTVHPLDDNAPRWYATTDQGRTELYFQDDLTKPLLVDRDGDGFCDDAERGPDNSRKPVASMTALEPSGNPPARRDPETFLATDDTRYYEAPGLEPACTSVLSPNFSDVRYRCTATSDMVRVINHSILSEPPEPVIYAIQPLSGESISCTGSYWEYASLVTRPTRDGWLCFAAVAYDKAGNRGVSPPLRICYDDPNTSEHPSCAATTIAPTTLYHEEWEDFVRRNDFWEPFRPRSAAADVPSCTDGCKIRVPDYPRIVRQQKHTQ